MDPYMNYSDLRRVVALEGASSDAAGDFRTLARDYVGKCMTRQINLFLAASAPASSVDLPNDPLLRQMTADVPE